MCHHLFQLTAHCRHHRRSSLPRCLVARCQAEASGLAFGFARLVGAQICPELDVEHEWSEAAAPRVQLDLTEELTLGRAAPVLQEDLASASLAFF